MNIKTPAIYNLNGRSYHAVDELIDYNLDRYNMVKSMISTHKQLADEFINNVNTHTTMDIDKFKKGFASFAFMEQIDDFISKLRKQFDVLVKLKTNGIKYLEIQNNNKKPA